MAEPTAKPKAKVGLIGPGNIGIDLMKKIVRSDHLALTCVVSIQESEGLKIAREYGASASAEGVDYMVKNHPDLDIVFDCTSAKGHLFNAKALDNINAFVIDLTPAALGPYCVPAVNMDDDMLNLKDVNLVTCAGQATVPIVSAINQVADVEYAEIVSAVSSVSAGPGTRANIDEFTVTTRKALETVGGADKAKVIIILNPAEPPILMRNTIYTMVKNPDIDAIRKACFAMVETMKTYVPGYTFILEPIIEGNIVTTIIQVEGLGDYLPIYAGNLDIINAAALHIGESKAKELASTLEEN